MFSAVHPLLRRTPASDKVIINIYKCIIKYQVKCEKYDQVELTDWYKDKQMFFQLYTVYTNTNDDEMSWKNEISATEREKRCS